MPSMKYTDLIGKHVTISYSKLRKTTEFKGVISDVIGQYLLLVQDNGERIWLPKIRKHDHMTVDDMEVSK